MSSSGVIDQMDGHDPSVILTGHGSVLLDIDGDTALRFRTVAAFDAWLETVNRSRAQLDASAYHDRFQSLRRAAS